MLGCVYAFLCYELTTRNYIYVYENVLGKMLEENVYLLAFIIEFPVLLSFPSVAQSHTIGECVYYIVCIDVAQNTEYILIHWNNQ